MVVQKEAFQMIKVLAFQEIQTFRFHIFNVLFPLFHQKGF